MPAGRPKSIDNSKVFDVAKPSNSKPVEGTRPVISNRSIAVKDSTVISVQQDAPKEVPSAPSVSRKIITPVTMGDETKIEATSDLPVEKADVAPVETDDAKVEQVTAPETAAVEETPVAASAEPDTETPVTASRGFKRELKIQPPSEVATEVAVEPAANPEASTEEAAANTDSVSAEETPKEEEVIPGATEEQKAASSDAAAVDAVADATGRSKEEQKAAEEQAKRDAALQELIDSKKYVVPLAHDSTKKGSGSTAGIALLILILLAAGAYLAIDAKILKLNVDLPYNFFNPSFPSSARSSY